MQTASLRKVGGSVMLAVPRAILDALKLNAGAQVGLEVTDGRLVVQPCAPKRYTMAELLAASDYTFPQAPEDREWLAAAPVGRELL